MTRRSLAVSFAVLALARESRAQEPAPPPPSASPPRTPAPTQTPPPAPTPTETSTPAPTQTSPPPTTQTPADAAPAAVHAPIASLSEGTSHTGTRASVTLAGYVEAFYQLNFNRPGNRITNDRAFDDRSNTFTLSNVVLDTSWSVDAVTGRLALQVGHTGATYYLDEPINTGTATVSQSDSSLWRYVQQANIGWRAPVGRGLLFEAGLFLSPIGPEGMAVKDQWNWSRSDLFVALPFYHAGARVTYPLTDALSVTGAVYNGWNSVVDDNDEKSFSAQITYNVPDEITLNALYFGGVERAVDAPERFGGPGSRGPWRHLFDAYAALYPGEGTFSFLVHADGGFEENRFGTSEWIGGAVYGRVQIVSWLFVALRFDRLSEKVASSSDGAATPLFFPTSVAWVESGTATLDFRPQDNISFRVEGRHDVAGGDLYFKGTVAGDGAEFPYVPNATSQTTLTFGVTSWFLLR